MYANAVQDLIDELGRLPGIGPKSAQRIAFHLLKLPPEDALRLAAAINTVKDKVTWCRRCFNIAETGGGRADTGPGPVVSGPVDSGPGPAGGGVECGICADDRRDATIVCVVEEPRDLIAIERTREFRGRYHVLQGAISPIDGIGADKLRIRELLARIQNEGIQELILCTNPNIEGDATAMYLTNLLRDLPVKVTQLASGLPVGSDLEYADEITLGRALEGRRTLG
jgi:recombination protein RecR